MSPCRVNLDACIHCGLCVRACREVQVNDVIGMSGRGMMPIRPLTWQTRWAKAPVLACGECVQACPTGALLPATVDENQIGDSKDFDSEVESICPFCGVGCQVSLKVKDRQDQICRRRNGPANEGRLCVKGTVWV